MTAQFRHSQVIDYPLTDVLRFYAECHGHNYPGLDPFPALEQQTCGRMDVRTIINRRDHRNGVPVDGSMERVGDEPGRSIDMLSMMVRWRCMGVQFLKLSTPIKL